VEFFVWGTDMPTKITCQRPISLLSLVDVCIVLCSNSSDVVMGLVGVDLVVGITD
jgi:hypothetical protein